MTTETATSQQTGKTLRAQRARAKAERDSADAELRALAAQEAAHLAEAEAEGARQQAEQQQALARLAEQRAELDKVDAFLAQQRQREYADIRAAVDRWHEMQRQLKELATMEIPPARRSMDEIRAFFAQLDAEQQAREEREERDRIDFEWQKRQARTLAAMRAERDRQQQ